MHTGLFAISEMPPSEGLKTPPPDYVTVSSFEDGGFFLYNEDLAEVGLLE